MTPPLAERPKRGLLTISPQPPNPGQAHLSRHRKPMAGESPAAKPCRGTSPFRVNPGAALAELRQNRLLPHSRGLYPAENIHQPNRKPHNPTEHSPVESRQTHEKGCRSTPHVRDDRFIVWNGKRVRRALRGQYGDLGRKRGLGA